MVPSPTSCPELSPTPGPALPRSDPVIRIAWTTHADRRPPMWSPRLGLVSRDPPWKCWTCGACQFSPTLRPPRAGPVRLCLADPRLPGRRDGGRRARRDWRRRVRQRRRGRRRRRRVGPRARHQHHRGRGRPGHRRAHRQGRRAGRLRGSQRLHDPRPRHPHSLPARRRRQLDPPRDPRGAPHPRRRGHRAPGPDPANPSRGELGSQELQQQLLLLGRRGRGPAGRDLFDRAARGRGHRHLLPGRGRQRDAAGLRARSATSRPRSR